MGDIYLDQGRLDDAIQWYCLAIDLDPGNAADRLKLTRAIDERRQQIAQVPRPLDLKIIKDLFGSRRFDPNRTKFWRSERPLRIFVFIASVACLSAVVAWPILSTHDSSAKRTSPADRFIDTSPISLIPFTGQPSTNAASQASGQIISDPTDNELLTKLRGNEELLGRSIVVTAVTNDPRTSRVTITYVSNPVADSPISRGQIARDGIRVAQAAVSAAAYSQPVGFTLRGLIPSPHGGDPLGFVGDISAGDVLALNPSDMTVSDTAMESHFANPWWSTFLSEATPDNQDVETASSTSAPAAAPAQQSPQNLTPELATPHGAVIPPAEPR
jgi:hypothetical protein